MRNICIFRNAIHHVPAQVVERLAGSQRSLGYGDNFNHGTSLRRNRRVIEEAGARNSVRHLEVTEMIGRVEAVERTFT